MAGSPFFGGAKRRIRRPLHRLFPNVAWFVFSYGLLQSVGVANRTPSPFLTQTIGDIVDPEFAVTTVGVAQNFLLGKLTRREILIHTADIVLSNGHPYDAPDQAKLALSTLAINHGRKASEKDPDLELALRNITAGLKRVAGWSVVHSAKKMSQRPGYDRLSAGMRQ